MKMFYIIQTIVKVIAFAKNIQKTIKFLSKDIFIYNEKLPIDDGKNLIWTVIVLAPDATFQHSFQELMQCIPSPEKQIQKHN